MRLRLPADPSALSPASGVSAPLAGDIEAAYRITLRRLDPNGDWKLTRLAANGLPLRTLATLGEADQFRDLLSTLEAEGDLPLPDEEGEISRAFFQAALTGHAEILDMLAARLSPLSYKEIAFDHAHPFPRVSAAPNVTLKKAAFAAALERGHAGAIDAMAQHATETYLERLYTYTGGYDKAPEGSAGPVLLYGRGMAVKEDFCRRWTRNQLRAARAEARAILRWKTQAGFVPHASLLDATPAGCDRETYLTAYRWLMQEGEARITPDIAACSAYIAARVFGTPSRMLAYWQRHGVECRHSFATSFHPIADPTPSLGADANITAMAQRLGADGDVMRWRLWGQSLLTQRKPGFAFTLPSAQLR